MNPELRRNLWLELTRHRLVVAPLVLVILLLLVTSRSFDPAGSGFSTAVGLFIFVVHLWGTNKAAGSVTDEVRDRTWDAQRLSSSGPWSMAWGKLLGAPAFPWYVGLLCLAAMGYFAMQGRMLRAPWIMLGLVASAIALHGAALAASVQAGRKDARLGAKAGVFMLVPLAIWVASLYGSADRDTVGAMTWYGLQVPMLVFMAASAVAFAAWAVLAAYREMQRELKVPAFPWAYPAFAIFAGAYAAGFEAVQSAGSVTAFVFGTFFAAMGLGYFGLFTDVTTAMLLRRMVVRCKRGDWKRALEDLPLWASVLPLAALFAVLSAMQPMPEAFGVEQRRLGLYPVAMFLMLLRDAGLLCFFALGPKGRRVEGTTFVYILLLSGILPTLFSVMGLDAVAMALVPFKLGGWQASLVMMVHVVVVWSAVVVRNRRLQRTLGG
jgi:hypothetical protein